MTEAHGSTNDSTDAAGEVIAVNLLLEPDATMVARATSNNERLMAAFPHGFRFDDTHLPHITLLQRFVRRADLMALRDAAGVEFALLDLSTLRLAAHRYYYIPSGPIGLAGIVARADATLTELQQRLINAVAPFTVHTGDSSAFHTTPADPVIDPVLIDYVTTFVPEATGGHFNPHVTTGVDTRERLDAMLAEPFDEFEFSPANAALFQLGQYGTAAVRLHAW